MAAQPGAPLNASSTSELCFLPSISIEHPKEKEKKKRKEKKGYRSKVKAMGMSLVLK